MMHRSPRFLLPTLCLAALALCGAARAGALKSYGVASAGEGDPCARTATLMFHACKAEVSDDYNTALALCEQLPDAAERADCSVEARGERGDAGTDCTEQRDARLDLCDLLGEERYDASFDPASYVDDWSAVVPNPYFPLAIGNRWSFETTDESNVIEVLPATKLVAGVRCIVVHDLVTTDEGGENTYDWFAQRLDGTVSYCGEAVQDFIVVPGDVPAEPEVLSIDGSFKHGREGELAGTIMLAAPMAGQAYRQEMSLGNAEDAALVLSTSYGFGDDPELDDLVPEELATLLCDHDCVVIGEWTPLEPDVFARKYYARGVGPFLEVEGSEVNRLVDCNVDPRCASLPGQQP